MLDSLKFTLMICFIPFLSFLGGAIYIPAFPELGLIFNVSEILIKFSLTVYFIGMIVGTVLSGLLSDLYGRLYILTYCLILFLISSLFCGFSVSIYWFFVGRFFQGLASAAGPIIIISFIADQFEGAKYNKYISYVLVASGISHGLAPIIGSFILHFFDWRSIFSFLIFMSLLAIWLIFSYGVEKKAKKTELKNILFQYIFSIKNPFFLYYCIIIGTFYGVISVILAISPYIFRLYYGWSIVEFAWVGLALAIADGMGAFLDYILSGKVENRKIIKSGFIIATATFIALFIIKLPPMSLLFLLMITFFIVGANLIAACLTTNAIKLNPQFTGVSASLIYLSKFTISSILLIFILFLPSSLFTINLFIFLSLLISILGYFKIRKNI